MTLLETKTAQWYQVEEIHEWENVQRRLEALGILEGTRVQVLNQKRNGSTTSVSAEPDGHWERKSQGELR